MPWASGKPGKRPSAMSTSNRRSPRSGAATLFRSSRTEQLLTAKLRIAHGLHLHRNEHDLRRAHQIVNNRLTATLEKATIALHLLHHPDVAHRNGRPVLRRTALHVRNA